MRTIESVARSTYVPKWPPPSAGGQSQSPLCHHVNPQMAYILRERLRRLSDLRPEEDAFPSFIVNATKDEAKWSPMVYVLYDIDPSGDFKKDSALLEERVHPDDKESVLQTRALSIKAGTGSFSVPYRIVWRDGTVLHVLAHWDVVLNDAGDTMCIGTVYDVTDLWKLQQQETEHLLVKRTLEEERRRREEVQRLLRTMSHEVRGPLQGIMSNTRLLLDEFEERMETSSDQSITLTADEAKLMKSCLEDTVECATHQLLCVNDYLDEVAQSKERLLRSDPVDIEAVVTSVAIMFKTAARDKGLTLTCVPAVERIVVMSDAVILKRIIMNLVSNALKYSDDGTIAIKVKHEAGNLSVLVEDEGCGVAPEIREKLFHETGVTTSSPDYVGGSGLGLCICRHLVEQMQGTIGFCDNTPRGTVFAFTVPAQRINVAPMPVHSPHGLVQRVQCEHLRGRSILVAEDNRIIQRVLRHMLEPLASKVTIANDGVEVLQVFNESRPDLLVLDINMPKMSGAEAAAALREGTWTSPALPSSVPIIFLTGEIASEVQLRVSAMQPCALLLKPASVGEIIEACQQLLPPLEPVVNDVSVGSYRVSPSRKPIEDSSTLGPSSEGGGSVRLRDSEAAAAQRPTAAGVAAPGADTWPPRVPSLDEPALRKRQPTMRRWVQAVLTSRRRPPKSPALAGP